VQERPKGLGVLLASLGVGNEVEQKVRLKAGSDLYVRVSEMRSCACTTVLITHDLGIVQTVVNTVMNLRVP